jgi:DNA-binding beta-propeller fold protein YncE
MDTSTFEVLDSLPVSVQPGDVRVGLENRLYVTPAIHSGGIMQIDAETGEFQDEFSFGVFIYSNGMLEISPDRESLYFANVGLSPGTLAKFDVSTPTASLLGRNPHGALGSNGQDLALSHTGEIVSYACGGGNGAGYSIFALDADVVGVSHLVSLILAWGECEDCPEDLDGNGVVDVSDLVDLIANWGNFLVLGEYVTGAYPRELTFSPDDQIVYAVHFSGHIDTFDANTYEPLSEMNTSGEAREMIVDRFGHYLFAAFDGELRVYDTGR